MVLELMAFRNDHQKVQEYLKENEEYFSKMDVTSSEAVGILLGCHRQVRKMIAEKQKGGEVDMCKALEELRMEGVLQGRTEGIRATVKTCKKFQINKEAIIETIGKEFSMPEKEVAEYVEKYW